MLIKINLVPGPKKKKKRAGAGVSLPNVGELLKGVNDPLLMGAVVSWIVAAGLIGFFFTTQQRELAALEREVESARVDAGRFSNMIAQKRRAENLRDSLVSELQAIRRIDGDRYVWPHVMEEVTKALPDYTWLVGLNIIANAPPVGAAADTTARAPVQLKVDGRTSDIGAYTRFLRQLSSSPWIGRVREGPTSTVIEQDKALTAFSITITFQLADSAFIRTVPLRQSVR